MLNVIAADLLHLTYIISCNRLWSYASRLWTWFLLPVVFCYVGYIARLQVLSAGCRDRCLTSLHTVSPSRGHSLPGTHKFNLANSLTIIKVYSIYSFLLWFPYYLLVSHLSLHPHPLPHYSLNSPRVWGTTAKLPLLIGCCTKSDWLP